MTDNLCHFNQRTENLADVRTFSWFTDDLKDITEAKTAMSRKVVNHEYAI